ncbi:MAG: T9SS type A sorting domain-containing protein [Bacteroidia bacterium]|nr:T9SS type A sorting domain-containing protein [Bacteroidia bacterium]
MRLFNFVLAFFLCLTCMNAQDYSKTPVISKVTATWCPNCGSWGWSFMEALKDEFNDDSALLLSVHHSGDLENPVSDWFSKNLKNTYQPQFFINNEMQGVNSGNWNNQVSAFRNLADNTSNQNGNSSFSFLKSYIDASNNIQVELDVAAMNKSEGEFFLGIYIYENNVINYQSQQGNNAVHPNVLRDVISDNYWGDAYLAGNSSSVVTKSYDLNSTDWNYNDLGLVAIMWEKVGNDYIMDNARFVNNIGLLSSNEELLDESAFDIRPGENRISVITSIDKELNLILTSSSGQNIYASVFRNLIEISTADLVPGIYFLTLQTDNGRLSKKVLVR